MDTSYNASFSDLGQPRQPSSAIANRVPAASTGSGSPTRPVPPLLDAGKHAGNPRPTVAALENVIATRLNELAKLQEEKQRLEARQAAMQHWMHALEAMIVSTQPLRHAALLSRRAGSGGPVSADHLMHQEEVLLACTEQLRAVKIRASGGISGSGQGRAAGTNDGACSSLQAGLPRLLSTSTDGRGGGSAGAGGSASGGSDLWIGTASDRLLSGVPEGAPLPSWTQQIPGGAAAIQGTAGDDGPALEAAVREYERYDGVAYCTRSKEFVQSAAVDLFHIRTRGCDVEGASARVSAGLDSLISFLAAMTALNPVACVNGYMTRLDTLQPVTPDTLPPQDHWKHCVQQMLASQQQMLEIRELLAAYMHKVGELTARKDTLMALLADQRLHASPQEDAEELLREIEQCQIAFMWESMTCSFALFSGILKPVQAASAVVSAFPFCPTLMGVQRGLEALDASASCGIAGGIAGGGGGGGAMGKRLGGSGPPKA